MQRDLLIKRTFLFILIIFIFSLTCHASLNGTDIFSDLEEKTKKLKEYLSFEYYINLFLSQLPKAFSQISKSFYSCTFIIIVSIIFSAIKENLKVDLEIFNKISTSLLVLCLFSPTALCFEKASSHLSAMCAYMISFTPTALLLHSFSGATITASFMSQSLPIAISILEFICIFTVLPTLKCLFSLTAINSLIKKSNLEGLCDFLKGFCLWFSGLCFTLFTGIISLQNILGSSADNLTMKGLKYGASRFIPIAGGLVSESMKSVLESVSYLKSTTGIAGIIFIIYTVIPPLCTVLIMKAFLWCLCFISKATGQEEKAKLLSCYNSCYNLLLALIIGCSTAFIIMFGVFMKTTVRI